VGFKPIWPTHINGYNKASAASTRFRFTAPRTRRPKQHCPITITARKRMKPANTRNSAMGRSHRHHHWCRTPPPGVSSSGADDEEEEEAAGPDGKGVGEEGTLVVVAVAAPAFLERKAVSPKDPAAPQLLSLSNPSGGMELAEAAPSSSPPSSLRGLSLGGSSRKGSSRREFKVALLFWPFWRRPPSSPPSSCRSTLPRGRLGSAFRTTLSGGECHHLCPCTMWLPTW